MRIEFKAYGGTGMLIARAWVVLAALNACNRGPDNQDHAVIYRMDLEDAAAIMKPKSDYAYLENIIADYQQLHKRGLSFLAPLKIELSKDLNHTLRAIRDRAYPDRGTPSLSSLYVKGEHLEQIKNMLTAGFTSDPRYGTGELERANNDGFYGDFAVGSFISQRMAGTQERNVYAASGIYNNLLSEIRGAAVFYAGAMESGTANIYMNHDIVSLLQYLQKNGVSTDRGRSFRLYALRPMPYSTFKADGGVTGTDGEVHHKILAERFDRTSSTLECIMEQNQYAASHPTTETIYDYSYFYDGVTPKYWVDGLFLGAGETLDETADAALGAGQFHPSHLVEFALAEQAMDAIDNRLPEHQGQHLYAYEDGGDRSNLTQVTLKTFFGHVNIRYTLKYVTSHVENSTTMSVRLDRYIYAYLLTLITVKEQLIEDFQKCQVRAVKRYISHLFNVGNVVVRAAEELPQIAPHVVKELEGFVKESRFIVDALVDVMQYSRFPQTDGVSFGSPLLHLLYGTDSSDNASGNAGEVLSIDEKHRIVAVKPGTAHFEVLDTIHEFEFRSSNPKTLKQERFYMGLIGDDAEKGRKVAHSLIERLFEIYLVTTYN